MMSISEGNMMEECRNGTFLFQDHTSVDTLIGKWLKEDVKVESKSCSDEMMEVEKSKKVEDKKEPVPLNSLTNDHDKKSKEDPEISVLDLWAHCTKCYETFKSVSRPEKMTKEKRFHSEARKTFETWFDVFLVRAMTMKPTDWDILMAQTSEKGILMADVIRSTLVEYLMQQLRNLCLHFEAYKDSEPLSKYLFGKGWRILKLLWRIETFATNELKNKKSNLSYTKSLKACSKQEKSVDVKTADNKEFVDLLLHLFQVNLQIGCYI